MNELPPYPSEQTPVYSSCETIASSRCNITAGSVAEILEQLAPIVTEFLGNSQDKWINIGFSHDGDTVRNIAISRDE